MAVLDHHDASPVTAKREPSGPVAACNLFLVFAALIGLAYIFSLVV
jgi:hypothetical protein